MHCPVEYAAKATVRPHSVVGPDLELQSRDGPAAVMSLAIR